MTEAHCYQAIHRRCAMYVQTGAKAVDLVLVAYKIENGKMHLVPIRVQVKNLRTYVTANRAALLLDGMRPGACQPHLHDSMLQIGLVMAIGCGAAEHMGGPVVEPSERPTRNANKRSTPYYGYLVSLKDSFYALRDYAHDGRKTVDLLESMASSASSFEEDDCFSDGYTPHINIW